MRIKLNLLVIAIVVGGSLTGCTNFLSSTSFLRDLTYTDTGVHRPDEFPILRSTGYAVISRQPGPTADDRTIQAMHASKADAYRELTEQVNGLYVKGNTTVNNNRAQTSTVSTEVEGYVHGARVIRQYPVGNNTFATELELDTKILYDLYDIRGTL